MAKTIKMTLSLLCVLLSAAVLFTFAASAGTDEIIAQGSCGAQGDDLTWTLTDEGALTIDGTGEMRNRLAPWREYKNLIVSVALNDGVTTIGSEAFIGCTSIESVSLPDTLKSIGESAFENTELTEITIPDSVTVIGQYAFRGASIQSITLSEALTGISYGCFENAELQEIILPDSVRSIGGYAFRNSTLSKITMSQNLTSIGYCAFEDCRKLTSVTLPEKVEIIDTGAFKNCTGVSTLNVNCRNLTDVGADTGKNAFENLGANCPEVTVTFGDKVKTIPAGMFYRTKAMYNYTPVFPKITAVYIGKNVTTIGEYAFSECKKLKTLHIDEDAALRSIGYCAFSGCTALETAILPKNLESVPSAFGGCTSMKQLTVFAQNLTDAGSAFSDAGIYAKSFEVIFADTVFVIPRHMFGDTTTRNEPSCGVTAVTLGKNIASIGAYAFQKCYRLETVTIPENSKLESIGESAFEDCKTLTAITLPKSLKELHHRAFKNCYYLESITFAAEWLQIDIPFVADWIPVNQYNDIFGGAGASADALTVLFEDTVQFIPAYLFYRNPNVTGITLGKSVKTIEKRAFYGCTGLTEITIPDENALSAIETGAFENCSSLQAIRISNPACFMNSLFGDHTIIFGHWNSSAHVFANANGYKFRLLTGLGDVNGDDLITAADARLALRAAVKLEDYGPGNRQFNAADTNGDHSITAADARIILRAAVGLQIL